MTQPNDERPSDEAMKLSWDLEQLDVARDDPRIIARAHALDAFARRRAEQAEKELERARTFLLTWLDKQGHDRCWYYPEILQQIADALDVKPTKLRGLPPREEFEVGCKRFQDEQYAAHPQPAPSETPPTTGATNGIS